jgi:hypothetical protein
VLAAEAALAHRAHQGKRSSWARSSCRHRPIAFRTLVDRSPETAHQPTFDYQGWISGSAIAVFEAALREQSERK